MSGIELGTLSSVSRVNVLSLQDPSSAIPIGTLLAILVTFLSYVGYAFMMGGCVLRDASGNVTEYLRAVAENPEEPWAIIANCTDRSCRFGLENDNQVNQPGYGVGLFMGPPNLWRLFRCHFVLSHRKFGWSSQSASGE
uniref:(California timema) hypothetical protein n=1 Tax=Timema californicum TaxID=61474 RepID=A0A7R9J419_TIMCA|nr:unnamed protein product [Timema californicum]